MNITKALILAAGNGTRLQRESSHLPKPLVSVGGMPLLRRVVLNAHQAGITHFVVVVGHLGQMVQDHFAQHAIAGVTFEWVVNDEYEKANGVSALKARHTLSEPFLLTMADHIFDAQTAYQLLQYPVGAGDVVLGVDRKLHCIFDIDDATKVRLSGEWIVDIGKSLTEYDAIDTGLFLCHPALFEALQASLRDGDCSLSDGIRYLAAQRRARAFDIQDAQWFDIDTPEAIQHAEAHLNGLAVRPIQSRHSADSACGAPSAATRAAQ
ncbi:MAG: phosphocholine cytidylyltransferase family protein [Acidobacteriota bacterium]|nr:phosphocholine cytidylyltransferase family protein [Blastocatellia bacterium]MDW8238055.1 phosphocholine cytidylyltransferase family protein [Acidobacteriota bacterium]